jgi:YegS/Rv2252/BmrU family lipid kinase
MKHLFIINPVAGKGRALHFIPEIEKAFSGRDDQSIIEITKYPAHATEIVKAYVDREDVRVYSVGGDGTLNEVLNGMAHSKSSLAVIPCGSGNDFIRSTGYHDDLCDILKRSIDAEEGTEKLIDIARINQRYFINISSAGFDGQVVLNTNKYKKLPFVSGSLAYILGILETVFCYKNNLLQIRIDDQQFETIALLIAIANGKYYGGGMMAAPEACIDDGNFDICLVRGVGKIKILRLFPRFIKGKHGSLKEVSFYRGKRVEISCKNDYILNIDGEICNNRQTIFEIIPKKLRLVVPKNYK